MRRLAIGGGAAACAACCATPLLAGLGIAVTGLAATVASLVLAGAAFAVVMLALTAGAVLVRRRRRTWTPTGSLTGSGHDARSLPDPVRRGGAD